MTNSQISQIAEEVFVAGAAEDLKVVPEEARRRFQSHREQNTARYQMLLRQVEMVADAMRGLGYRIELEIEIQRRAANQHGSHSS